jgi:hypothetical protein
MRDEAQTRLRQWGEKEAPSIGSLLWPEVAAKAQTKLELSTSIQKDI